mgnify:CR=1 FL=1
MQAKGFIKFIIAGLLIFAIYQLSFTFLDANFKNKAEAYGIEKAAGFEGAEANFKEKQETKNYLDSIKNETVVNLGFTELTYKDISDNALKLGLDLKGGISLLVEIDNADLLRKLSHESEDEAFNAALVKTVDEQKNSTDGFVDAFAKNYNTVSNGSNLAAIFAPYEEYKGKIDWKDNNEKVIKELKEVIRSKWDETQNVLSTRIDEFSVSNTFISKPDEKGRIFIELPGADDIERIEKIIRTSALLEFYKVYTVKDVDPILAKINDVVRTKLGLDEEVVNEAAIEQDTVQAVNEDIVNDDINSDSSELGSLEGLETPGTDPLGDDSISNKANPLFEVLQPNYVQRDGQFFLGEGPVIGYAVRRNKATIDEYFAMEEVKALFPRDLVFMWSAKAQKNEDGTEGDVYLLYAVKKTNGRAYLNGDVIVDAFNSKDQLGRDVVSMSMNANGAKIWADLTRETNPTGDQNAGESIAIVLDNKIFSAPRSNGEITGGSSQITGMDGLDEAKDLATILKSGKLEAKINIPQKAVVGASMGKAAIKSGLTALAIGLLLVILFMFLYYSGAGFIANTALVVNLVLIMGALTSLKAALTLPGMAGIVLTIGMAVDANVIIFERIREELRKGKGLKLAISDGFKYSYSAIIDANVTTLIAGTILYSFGAGPVKGFAIVLIIGIVASFISAVFLSRLIFDYLMNKDKNVGFSSGWSENVLTNTNYDFLGKRKIAYIISSVIIIAGLVSIFTTGFELGVDFKGGRSYVVAFDKDVSTDAIREKLSTVFIEDGKKNEAVVKRFDVDSKVQITTAYKIDDASKEIDSVIIDKLHSGLAEFYNDAPNRDDFLSTNILQANKVDTTIADDIKTSAFEAGLLGALLIFLYILFRFRKWQYGAGAIVAVVHDILIILSIFSIFKHIMPFSLEIEQKFIAAILTIIGYSINDTVVVFDRIREYLTEFPSKEFKGNVNSAINGTISRTLMTSLTTLFVVAILFLFGGTAIKGFAFALLVGVFVGTYSSIFIASSILVDTWKVQKKLSKKK